MITVRNIMTKDVVTVYPSSSIMDAAKLINSKSVSSLVVVDKGKPIGVISVSDIVRGIVSKKAKVREVMNREFEVVSPDARFSEISRRLRERKVKRFPVVENDKLIGLITETDIVQATRDFTRLHQIVQEIILAVFGLATAFFLFYFSPLAAAIFG